VWFCRREEIADDEILDGSTETGGPILLRPEREDWQYLEPHPDYADEFEPVMDGVFELVYRDKGKLKPPLVYTYTQPAGTREYRTKDLFVPHLTKSGLWRFYGRRDDVLVLSTGLKMNPLPVELAVTGHPGVSGSLVVGQGRDRTVLLIEPIERVGEIETFLEGLWPAVERANADLDEGARVERNMLLVVEPGAFVRAPKGTVVRQRTTDNFDGDIGKIIQAASRRDLGALANEQLVRNRSGPRFREPMCLKK
jgi:acyl-CoA synthetase (AMP-forming)/AMP-acid ligase II